MLKLYSSARRACRRNASQKFVVRELVSYSAKAFVPNPKGPNIELIRRLTQEMEMEMQKEKSEAFKVRAFRRAIRVIDLLPEAIISGNEAININGVGEGIARRIDEYLNPGRELTPKPSESRQMTVEEVECEKSLSEFRRVPGIGPVKARKLFEAGCRSLDDMRKPEYLSTLSLPIRTALDYVEHLALRVTRAQVDAVMWTIKSIVSSEFRMHAVGSYRRGFPTCSDIDVILFHPSCVYVPRPGEKSSAGFSSPPGSTRRGRLTKQVSASRVKQDTLLREFLLGPLEHEGVLAATLVEGPRKWQGIVRIPGPNEGLEEQVMGIRDRKGTFRRMDLSLFPCLSKGAALLATTGDTDFNAHLRELASKKGLHLNEFGLWRFCRNSSVSNGSPNEMSDVEQPTNSKSGSDGTRRREGEEDGRWELVASSTEQEVLNELALGYVEPERRNFAFVMSRPRHGPVRKTQGVILDSADAVLKST
ncbi:Nucleotidyltransferase [Phellopilus nigrolimitatus]|nr:Nucleotidyltransferase [Phellopilus nigrolimitatus]